MVSTSIFVVAPKSFLNRNVFFVCVRGDKQILNAVTNQRLFSGCTCGGTHCIDKSTPTQIVIFVAEIHYLSSPFMSAFLEEEKHISWLDQCMSSSMYAEQELLLRYFFLSLFFCRIGVTTNAECCN